MLRLHRTPARAQDTLVGAMLECHERIRRFCSAAVRLAAATDAPVEQVRATATDVHRYFTLALPLHATDEDELLAPALHAHDLSPALSELLEVLPREHAEMDELLVVLVPVWAQLAEGATSVVAVRPRLEPATRRFVDLMTRHIEKEERTLFPEAARLLGAEEQQDLLLALRAKRNRRV